MSSDITLYIQPGFQLDDYHYCYSGTPFAIKVERLLNFKRLAFTTFEIEWAEREKWLSRVSHSKKLPVLQYDDHLIEDSSQIAYFIEELHPLPALIPENKRHAAQMHFLEEWADEVLYWYLIYGQVYFDDGERTRQAYFSEMPDEVSYRAIELLREGLENKLRQQGFGCYPATKFVAELKRSLNHLEELLYTSEFLVEDEITLADIAVFAQIHRAMSGTHAWFEMEIARRPAISRWLGMVDERTVRESWGVLA